LRVLRGERGNDAGAVDAERGEGLQVGLDAGAARGIRAGNGQRDGGRHPCPRRFNASSTAARSSRAAATGSAASDSAEITATPSAPAAITSPALAAVMPAMAHTG